MFFYFIFIFALYCCSFCLFCLSLLFLSLITGFVFSFHSLTLSCSFALYFVIFHTFLFLHFHLFSFFIDFFSLGLDSVSSLVLSALCCCPILSYTPAEFICLFPLCCLFFCFLPFLVFYPLALFLFFFPLLFLLCDFFPPFASYVSHLHFSHGFTGCRTAFIFFLPFFYKYGDENNMPANYFLLSKFYFFPLFFIHI